MLGDSLRRSRSAAAPKPPRPRRPVTGFAGIGWGRWVLIGLGVLGLSFVVGFLLSVFVLFPAPETAGTGIPVPGLYGMEWAEAQDAVEAAGLTVGEITELAIADAPEGQVLAQTPVPGQQLRRGAAVELVVSAGPPELRVPPVAGLGVPAARELLEAAGFDVQVTPVPSPLPEGVVTGTEPAAGAVQRLPATLTLMASVGPPGDTMTTDTTSGPAAAPMADPATDTVPLP